MEMKISIFGMFYPINYLLAFTFHLAFHFISMNHTIIEDCPELFCFGWLSFRPRI